MCIYRRRVSACRERKQKRVLAEKEKQKEEEEATIKEDMDTQNSQTANQPTAAVSTTSCTTHVKDDNATFLVNIKGHFNKFVNTSMDEHKACFKNTMDKVRSKFSISSGMSMAAEEKKIEVKDVEGHSPL